MALLPRELLELESERELLCAAVEVARRCPDRLPDELLDRLLRHRGTPGPCLPRQRPSRPGGSAR